MCLALERGGSDLNGDGHLDIDCGIESCVFVKPPKPAEISCKLQLKYINTSKKKKTTGTNIVIWANSQLGDLAPEVEIDGTVKSSPAMNAGVIALTTEQTNSVAELHSEPRAPVFLHD